MFLKWCFHTQQYVAAAAAAAKSLQSCPTLCDPIDGSPPGSPVPGILQARILEWVAISFSNAWKRKVKVKSFSRVWLSDPMDCSLSGSSIHGIFQARILEWVAISYSRGSSRPRDQTHIFCILCIGTTIGPDKNEDFKNLIFFGCVYNIFYNYI